MMMKVSSSRRVIGVLAWIAAVGILTTSTAAVYSVLTLAGS
jgi:hypothetical protein